MKIFKVLCFVFFTSLFIIKSSFAQGMPEDNYRQMGGIAGLSELCSSPKNLEKILFQQLAQYFHSNPDSGRYINKLLNLYFESYDVAIQRKVMWIGQTQSYNKSPFDCSEESKKIVVDLENKFIKSLQPK